MSIAKAMRQYRKDVKMSQEQLGEICGVSRVTISHWETGAGEPSASHIERFCEQVKCLVICGNGGWRVAK
jgi:transcriptional regulator with XRE-family HTH domain